MLTVTCPECGARFNIRETSLNTVRVCHGCGERVIPYDDEPVAVARPVRRSARPRPPYSPLARAAGFLLGVLLFPLLCCGLPLYFIAQRHHDTAAEVVAEPGEAKGGEGAEDAAEAKPGTPGPTAAKPSDGLLAAWSHDPPEPPAGALVRDGPRGVKTAYVSGYTRSDGRHVAGYYRRR